MLLAQIHVDAAGEETAERRVHHLHRLEFRNRSRRANRADTHLRLRRARPIDDEDARLRR